jgi:uncharacterized protein
MLNSAIIRIVDFCAQRRWQVLAVGILFAAAAATYDVARFSITTDTQSLISQDLPWHQRQTALSKAFPQKGILVVVTAATPENAERATNALERDLSKRSDLFRTVVQTDSGDFSSIMVHFSNLCPPLRSRLADCRRLSFSLAHSRAIQAFAV